MYSKFGGRPGAVYRLVVTTHHEELVCDAPVFGHYKRAVSHIPDAVRRHSRDGDLKSVILQRALPQSTPDNVTWTALEHWDNTVITRILRQQGNTDERQRPAGVRSHSRSQTGAVPRAPRRSRSHTAPAARPNPAPAPQPRAPLCLGLTHTARPKGHRWHWGLALAAAAWIAIAAVVSNGGWASWLPIGGPEESALATELPFDAPDSAPAEAWEPSQASSQVP